MGICLNLLVCLWSANHTLLVSTDQVSTLTDSLVVDTRPLAAYTEGHIPGAIHLDVNSLSETRDGVAGLLKPVDHIWKALGDAGIDPARHVIVYCGMENADDLKDAARMFWILEYLGYDRVSALDGGFAKWESEKRTVERGGPTYTPVEMPELSLRPDRIASAADVEKAIDDNTATIADLRGADFFKGAKKADIVKAAGHIPKAVNLPAESLVEGENNTVKPILELQELLKKSAIPDGHRVITYCNSGRSASVGYFILRNLGRENVAMYDGSMSEWTAAGDRPVICDEQAKPGSSIQNPESQNRELKAGETQ